MIYGIATTLGLKDTLTSLRMGMEELPYPFIPSIFRMKYLALLLCPILATLNFIPTGTACAQEAPAIADYTAEEVVKLVHLSRALKKHELTGQLRKADVRADFRVTLTDKLMDFRFANPEQQVRLDLGDSNYKLVDSGKPVPEANYGVGIRGTDLSYEDLSFRYLYWANPIKLNSETFATRKCWKVQLNNPRQGTGAYNSVVIWVDQQSGGLMKMEGYLYEKRDGKDVFTMIKRCAVKSGMKIDDATVLKEMSIEAFDPKTGKGLGKTFLELNKP